MTNLHRDAPCKKNPGHKEFIPAQSFTKDYLPQGYRDDWRVEMVRALSDLTVLIKVEKISERRPQFYSDVPFPLHKPGGGTVPRVGSGFVWDVTKFGDGGDCNANHPCGCDECRASPTPQRTWWQIDIASVSHVLFDDAEAADAKITFFYDDDQAMSSLTVEATRAHEVVRADMNGARCDFTVITHNGKFVDRLIKAKNQYKHLRYSRDEMPNEPVVVVSHPHGLSKHITVGKFVSSEPFGEGSECGRRIIYTAQTCPGSGGGLVSAGWSVFPHSEAVNIEEGTNRSGRGLYIL